MQKPPTRTGLALILLALAFAWPAITEAQYRRTPVRGHVGTANVFRIGLSSLTPQGDEDYWEEKQLDFTGEPDDLEDVSFTVDYQRLLSSRLALQISGNFYNGDTDQSYLRFEDGLGRAISHTTTLERNAFTAGLVVHPIGHDVAVAPYLGAGVGLYDWRLEESGDFIIFADPGLPIVVDTFESEGTDFGWYGHVGLEVPMGRTWALFLEGRWDQATAELEQDFEGFGDLDLGSEQYGIGFSWSF